MCVNTKGDAVNFMMYQFTTILLMNIIGSTSFMTPDQFKKNRNSLAVLNDSRVNVGVLDGPLDPKHPELKDKLIEKNICVYDPEEGKLDCGETHGWDFVHQKLHKNHFSDDSYNEIIQFMNLSSKFENNKQLKDEEIDFLKKRSQNKEFMSMVKNFISNSHGTHVAGIIAEDNDHVKLIGLDIVPFSKYDDSDISLIRFPVNNISTKNIFMLRSIINDLAKESSKTYQNLVTYLKFHKIDIVNGSYGQEVAQFMWRIFLAYGFNPDSKAFHELCKFYIKRSNQLISNELAKSKKTLFVFAAGNSANDNDKVPTIPAGINQYIDNVISVAAVDKHQSLASFSNYGLNTVDIAAEGVDITSGGPSGIKIKMSGTSQAAPSVTRAASKLKSQSVDLLPAEIKLILMSTVDKYDELQDKIKSGGILNEKRALVALEIYHQQSSSEKNLEKACAQSYEKFPQKFSVPSWVQKIVAS